MFGTCATLLFILISVPHFLARICNVEGALFFSGFEGISFHAMHSCCWRTHCTVPEYSH